MSTIDVTMPEQALAQTLVSSSSSSASSSSASGDSCQAMVDDKSATLATSEPTSAEEPTVKTSSMAEDDIKGEESARPTAKSMSDKDEEEEDEDEDEEEEDEEEEDEESVPQSKPAAKPAASDEEEDEDEEDEEGEEESAQQSKPAAKLSASDEEEDEEEEESAKAAAPSASLGEDEEESEDDQSEEGSKSASTTSSKSKKQSDARLWKTVSPEEVEEIRVEILDKINSSGKDDAGKDAMVQNDAVMKELFIVELKNRNISCVGAYTLKIREWRDWNSGKLPKAKAPRLSGGKRKSSDSEAVGGAGAAASAASPASAGGGAGGANVVKKKARTLPSPSSQDITPLLEQMRSSPALQSEFLASPVLSL